MPSGFAQAPPGNAGGRQPRPQNAELQVQNLPPELEKLLLAWSQKSAQVQKLQGTHHRYVYNTVFMVEKRSEGVFYYEGPGKGRIDLTPAEIAKGEVSKRLDKDGKPFKVQPDRSERWMCDGNDIWQVDDMTKQVNIYPIPKENQGQNIMDGPMPFLFGMPPEKAKRRYHLKLVHESDEQAVIEVHPRLAVDAANWRRASVILDKRNNLYLPRAVQLIDPSGNLETVYTFGEFQVNKDGRNWLMKVFGAGEADPFRPKLKGYAFKVHAIRENPPADGPLVPSVAGLGWKDAKDLLEKLGCTVKIYTGQKAPQGALTHVVYNQKPAAKSPLQKGQQVVLTIYDQAPAEAPQAGQVPSVLGLFWKEAGAKLEQAGYKVKYLPGKTTPGPDKVFMVYQQAPNAGQPLQPGGEITLTVYNKAP